MKRILAPILLLTLMFPSIAFGETMNDLVWRDGILYKKFSTVPFTGKVTGKKQGSLRNGKRVGPWVTYHENGQLDYKGTFKDGKREGPWVSYYENGQLESRTTWKEGKMDGTSVFYDENGQLLIKETHKNGKLTSKETFKDGVKVK